MSTNTTNPTPSVPMAPVIPPGLNAIAVIQPSLNSIMIGHTFLTLLLPLLLALFYFSNANARRRPIFILNVAAILLAFTAGTMIDAFAIHSILSPQNPWPPSMNIAIGILGAFQSILVDLILLVRLASVHPFHHLGFKRFGLLTALPILLKIARVVNMLIFIKVLADAARGPEGPENIAVVWATTPYLKIEWSAQVVDNAYASIAFLWTIRKRGMNRRGVTSDISPNKVTFAQRMRTLSRIALSNFVIPSLFSLAQLVVVYRNVNVLIVNEIVLVNTMLAVFGVVFATVWAGKEGRREAEAWDKARGREDAERRESKSARAFAVPGLGTWKVATSPPTVTLGTTDITTSFRQHELSAVDKKREDGLSFDEGEEIRLHSLDMEGAQIKTGSASPS
ncbi:hypothetical protein HYDPIDRAFT_25904 [Hydnomerulius pinastri MD-312]|nr:hypothetical protein HYDPIDRAFT_25904 [Hydnomerulius pinastri MD-312]